MGWTTSPYWIPLCSASPFWVDSASYPILWTTLLWMYRMFEQSSDELHQRADLSVKQPSKINGYFQVDPLWVLLSVQVPKQIWQHNGRSPEWTQMGSQEHWIKLSETLKKYKEWHLKYQKDKKAWHNHTSTGSPTLIQIIHLRSNTEADPGRPVPSAALCQVCWSNPFYVELNIGSTKATGVKTRPERKTKRYVRPQGKLSVRLIPVNLISKQLN